jgi:hypothetical protein
MDEAVRSIQRRLIMARLGHVGEIALIELAKVLFLVGK